MPLLFLLLYIENGTQFKLLNWLRKLVPEEEVILNVELRLKTLQVVWGHIGITNSRDGFRYSISYKKKSLYAKEILCFPVFPLKQSSENLSADLTDCSQKSDSSEYIYLSPKLLFVVNCLSAVLHVTWGHQKLEKYLINPIPITPRRTISSTDRCKILELNRDSLYLSLEPTDDFSSA